MTELNLHLLTGAYALDALDPDEQSLFLAHLDECESCQAEAAGLIRTAVRLADVVAETPPPALRARVLQAADRTRQDAPVVTSLDAARERRRRVTAGIASLLVAAAIAIGIAVAVNQEPSHSDIVASVIEAPDSRTLNGTVAGGGSATVIFSRSQQAGVVKLNDLPGLPSDKTYELWLLDADGAHPAGLFVPSDSGTVTQVVSDVGPAIGVAVTVEPSAGSKRPTEPIILKVAWA